MTEYKLVVVGGKLDLNFHWKNVARLLKLSLVLRGQNINSWFSDKFYLEAWFSLPL